MKQFAGFLLLLAIVFGGLAVWQSTHEQAGDAGGETVSLQGRSITHPYLEQCRHEIQAFRSFPLDFEVTTLDGKALRKEDFAGRVLIVDIWATWCPPCRAEIPSFVELQSKYEDAGLSILGMNYERSESDKDAELAIEKFQKTQPMNYPLALGEASFTEQVPDFSGYPTTLFIDGTGTVRMMLVGAHPLENLEGYVLALLGELDNPAPVPAAAKPKRKLPTAVKPPSSNGSGLQENPYSQTGGT